MLLASDPPLILVDEPAAGMTEAEIKRTAELLRRIAGGTRHRHRARHGLRPGAGLQGDRAARGGPRRGSLDHVSANPKGVDVYLGRIDRCWTVQHRPQVRCRPGAEDVTVAAEPARYCILGRNGVGKTSLIRAISGLRASGASPGKASDISRPPPRRPRAPASATCRRGARSSRC